MYLSGSTPTLTQNTIQSNPTGIYCSNSNPIIQNNNIAGNTNYGVYNTTGITVDAVSNWWGDASGPTHPINPNGKGDKISDNVAFIPWLTGPVERDTTTPTVVDKIPAQDAANVPITTTIDITFSEPMNQTATEEEFVLKEGEQNITGEFSWTNNTMRFTPDKNIRYNTLYTVSLTSGARDLAGNPLDSITWSFTTEEEDTIPPAAVTDLAIQTVKRNSVTLSWTATGDDGNIGRASAYDLRYSTSEITDDNFDAATKVENLPAPQVAGSQEVLTITDLTPQTTYYFALKVLDEAPNISDLSNVVSTTTSALMGDVSGDGTISGYDGALILKNVVELLILTPEQQQAADVDCDGDIDSFDASLIIQYVVGNISELPYCQSGQAPVSSELSRLNIGVTLPDLSIKQGSPIIWPINIYNPMNLVSACELTLSYESNLKPIKVTTTSSTDDYTFAYNIQKDYIKIALTSAEGFKKSGAIVNIEFEPVSQLITSELSLFELRLNGHLLPSNAMGMLEVAPPKSALLQNYPNPFNPETWIPYQLSKEAEVTIKIFNIQGQLVRTITLGEKPAGLYWTKEKSAYWNGRNQAGENVATGIYFYTIQTNHFTATGRMILLK